MVGMAEPSYRPDRFDVVLGRGATRDEVERAAWAKAKGRCAEGESSRGLAVAKTGYADSDNDALLHWTVNVQYGPP
jgi:hypothetical protein